MKEKVVCFTGHRPEKLPCQNRGSVQTMMLKSFLYKQIYDCIQDGYTVFVAGLSMGVDMWASTIVMSFMEKYPDIKLITVSPYKAFGEDRKNADYWEYRNTIEKSSEVIYISDEYYKGCMKKRNLAMIDMSDRIIGVIKENRSGTSQTIRYAMKKGLEAHIINIGNAFEDIEEDTPFLI